MHTCQKESTIVTKIRTRAAILVGATTISLIGPLVPAALAHADSSAAWTADQGAVLVTSRSFTSNEQEFITDVESMGWYPVAAVGNTNIETDMVKLGWTVVLAVRNGLSPSALAAVIYRSFSKTEMNRDDAAGLVQLAVFDLAGSPSVDSGPVV